jgi:hypothetical protein
MTEFWKILALVLSYSLLSLNIAIKVEGFLPRVESWLQQTSTETDEGCLRVAMKVTTIS